VEVRFPIIGRTRITATSELAGRVLKDSETFTMRKDGRCPPISSTRLCDVSQPVRPWSQGTTDVPSPRIIGGRRPSVF